MRHVPLRAVAALLASLVIAGKLAAAQEGIAREHHAWGRFPAGSWKLVRVTTETFDAAGNLASTSATETKTTLKEVGEESFTLLVEATIEVGGKKVIAQPQIITQNYNGALPGQTAASRAAGTEQVTVEGKTYPCQVQEIEVSGPAGKTITRAFYNPQIAPYVLRRDSTTHDAATGEVTGQMLLVVTALGMPYRVRGEMHSTAHVRLEQRHAKGKETAIAFNAMEVPGGVVAHYAKELDADGRLVSRSVLELLDYGVPGEPIHAGQSGRLRFLPRARVREGRPMSLWNRPGWSASPEACLRIRVCASY